MRPHLTQAEWAAVSEKMKQANNDLTQLFHTLQNSTGKTKLQPFKQAMRKLSRAQSAILSIAEDQIGGEAADQIFLRNGWIYWP